MRISMLHALLAIAHTSPKCQNTRRIYFTFAETEYEITIPKTLFIIITVLHSCEDAGGETAQQNGAD